MSLFLHHTGRHIPNSEEVAKQEVVALAPVPPASPEEQAVLVESEEVVKEALVEKCMREKDELASVSGAEEPQIEVEVSLADMITQF